MKGYKEKIKNAHLNTKRSLLTSKLEKSAIAMLHKSYNKAIQKIPKLDKFDHLMEDEYVLQRDTANFEALECIERMKRLDVSLFCEKEKLVAAKYQKLSISKQLRDQIQVLYDVKYLLTKLTSKNNCE